MRDGADAGVASMKAAFKRQAEFKVDMCGCGSLLYRSAPDSPHLRRPAFDLGSGVRARASQHRSQRWPYSGAHPRRDLGHAGLISPLWLSIGHVRRFAARTLSQRVGKTRVPVTVRGTALTRAAREGLRASTSATSNFPKTLREIPPPLGKDAMRSASSCLISSRAEPPCGDGGAMAVRAMSPVKTSSFELRNSYPGVRQGRHMRVEATANDVVCCRYLARSSWCSSMMVARSVCFVSTVVISFMVVSPQGLRG